MERNSYSAALQRHITFFPNRRIILIASRFFWIGSHTEQHPSITTGLSEIGESNTQQQASPTQDHTLASTSAPYQALSKPENSTSLQQASPGSDRILASTSAPHHAFLGNEESSIPQQASLRSDRIPASTSAPHQPPWISESPPPVTRSQKPAASHCQPPPVANMSSPQEQSANMSED